MAARGLVGEFLSVKLMLSPPDCLSSVPARRLNLVDKWFLTFRVPLLNRTNTIGIQAQIIPIFNSAMLQRSQ